MPRHPIPPQDTLRLAHARRGLAWAIPLALVMSGLAVGAATAQADPAVTADTAAVSAVVAPVDPAPTPMTSATAPATTAATTDPPAGCYPPPAASAPATGSPQPYMTAPSVWPNPGAPVTADFIPAVQFAGGIATLRVDTSGAGLYPAPCGQPVIPTVVAQPSVPAGLTDASGAAWPDDPDPAVQPSVSAGSTDATGPQPSVSTGSTDAIRFVQDPSNPYVYTAFVTARPSHDTTYTLPIAVYPGGVDPVIVTATVTFVTGDCIAATSTEMTVSPAGPLPVGTGAASTYTITVTRHIDGTGCPPEPPVMVDFAVTHPYVPVMASSQPRFSNTSCSLDSTGTCVVTVTSTVSGSFPIHGFITDPATGTVTDIAGTGDPTTASPQTLTWTAPPPNPWTALLQQLQLFLQQLLAFLRNLFVLPVPLNIP